MYMDALSICMSVHAMVPTEARQKRGKGPMEQEVKSIVSGPMRAGNGT